MERKRAKIHMLPTKDESCITFGKESSVNYSYGLRYIETASKSSNTTKTERQHLYITVDERPADGDWYIYNGELLRQQNDKYNPSGKLVAKNCKIIATTDPVLRTLTRRGKHEMEMHDRAGNPYPKEPIGWYAPLPSPSPAFIAKYCRVGGIDEVDVEY